MHRQIPKAVTFFAGARDHYELPLALAERGWLERFVTEAYWPLENRWVGGLAERVLPGSWSKLRHREGLSSRQVRLDWRALTAVALSKIRPDPALYHVMDRALGRRGRRIAARTGASVFSYSYYAHAAFREGSDRPERRFLFQVHPHPASVRRILREELERYPWASASLLREEELGSSNQRFDELCEEPTLANGWVAASSFTARTLAEHGVPLASVHVVPYGVDGARFPARAAANPSSGPLRLVFLGSMIQRKGLCDLFEAVRRLGPRHVKLTLVGRGYVDAALLEHYRDVEPLVRRAVSPDELIRLLHDSDLFVLPSLVEGFGHVVVEAMSAGLPVLASTHTCAVDLVEPGVEGWVVPIRSPDAIAERLAWAVDHRAELRQMGEAAARRARTLDWHRFREGIARAYLAMLEGRGPSVAA